MKDFKKYYKVKTTPDQLYLGLTVELTIHLWSGEQTTFIAEEGAEFSLFDGNILGKNIELIPNEKIVQQWYFGDQEQDSIVTFILHENKSNTSLELRHTNIPGEDYEDMVDGWNDVFMSRLMEFYDE
ncbi:MAG: SRPBCC domain-containing protein [Bacteroidales bacterium]|nr:SRPBCC domain-containing protein [Bacteroidales bacterium]